jgi:hypothetical protein
VKDVNDIPNVLQELEDKGYEIEANIEKPLNDFGYKGINTNADLGDGYKGEVQVHTPESWKIKKESDAIYQKWRDKDFNKFTAEAKNEFEQDKNNNVDLFSNYWNNLPKDLIDKISSFDKSGAVKTFPADNLPTLPHDNPPSNDRKDLPLEIATKEPSSNLQTVGNFSSEDLIEDSISNNFDSIKDNKTNTKSQEGTNNDTTDGQAKEKPAGNIFGRFWEADLKPGVKKERQAVKDAIKGIVVICFQKFSLTYL